MHVKQDIFLILLGLKSFTFTQPQEGPRLDHGLWIPMVESPAVTSLSNTLNSISPRFILTRRVIFLRFSPKDLRSSFPLVIILRVIVFANQLTLIINIFIVYNTSVIGDRLYVISLFPLGERTKAYHGFPSGSALIPLLLLSMLRNTCWLLSLSVFQFNVFLFILLCSKCDSTQFTLYLLLI